MPDLENRKSSIAFVLPDFYAGGAQNVMLMLAGGLDRAKYEPTIIVFKGEGPWLDRLPSGIDVIDLERSGLTRAIPALRRKLRELNPDIVLSTMGYVNLGVLLQKPMGNHAGTYIVREANALLPAGTGKLKSMLLRLAYRSLYPRAHRVIAPSGRIIDELAAETGIGRHAFSVLRNPVMTARLRDAAHPVRRAPGKGPRFVCVGRLNEQKAYGRLIDMMHEHDTPGQVTILGEGPERKALERKIAGYGLEDRIALAGFDPNPAPWVAGADALLLPSLWEGLPNVALEALALGTPVIAAPEAGGIAEIAALAGEDTVRIASIGRAFAEHMRSVRSFTGESPRRSLLPDDFTPESVQMQFKSILNTASSHA